MPRIFDNIDTELLPALRSTLEKARSADFCVGYMNLRGWRHVNDLFNQWAGNEGACCRLLVGMPVDEERGLKRSYALIPEDHLMDQGTVIRLKKQMAQRFRDQLMLGMPTDADQIGLRTLARQLRQRKLIVKLHARYPLHAKLYLAHRDDSDNPMTAYLGSSNLTHSGLRTQGELNIDVLDQDATKKLAKWFQDRWDDKYSLDINDELIAIIDDSWVTERTPFQVYIKMAYHLSREARTGIEGFAIPRIFGDKLFEYQVEAVKIAAHHLERRGGVMLGDVVGLGKTLMASAVARLFIERHHLVPLIICPPNLIPMWETYSNDYELYARILSLGQVHKLAGEFSRHRLVIVDESHNLRNRESKTYAHIKKYIDDMQASVMLLSATPYNKGYEDISSQLRLFLGEEQNLGIRPESYINTLPNGEIDFNAKHQCPVHCIRAFEHSPLKEDWQQLMQRYMVRRTRTFIKRHYAQTDEETGRKFLLAADGVKKPFPDRIPHTVKFEFDETKPDDPYARLFSQPVVDLINSLSLPRYGLGNHVAQDASMHASNEEMGLIQDLGRAGKRLMGFCRTNLYKRLESCGEAFLLSVDRHILRNYIFAYAIENEFPLPIGTQDPAMLDTASSDADSDLLPREEALGQVTLGDDEPTAETLFDDLLAQQKLPIGSGKPDPYSVWEKKMRERAKRSYELLSGPHKSRFQWIKSALFADSLLVALLGDARSLTRILIENPDWNPEHDRKLKELCRLTQDLHPTEKVLVFTQFADTAAYLERGLKEMGVQNCEAVTGNSSDIADTAARFSPQSNLRTPAHPGKEIRVLVATDVLSEGQNLQDGHVIVNFDLPWAIIRLVQRAGRVDRIGQESPTIDCYTFAPMAGIETIINLRAKVRLRLTQNAEVVGTDEAFFDDDGQDQPLVDLYNEKAGILDGSEDESEVDLQSRAYQIYKDAIEADPHLERLIENMPDVVYSGKDRQDQETGILVYVRTPDDADSLAYVGADGKSITENQAEILAIAKCEPHTPIAKHLAEHHKLVRRGVEMLVRAERQSGGQLGRPSGARYRGFMALKRYLEANAKNVLVPPEMAKALEQLHYHPLRQSSVDALNRCLRRNGTDEEVANLITDLYNEQRLCIVEDEEGTLDPRIICSLSLT